MDWNGQENFSLSCELWVGTNDFNAKKNVPVRSNPRIIFLSGNYQPLHSLLLNKFIIINIIMIDTIPQKSLEHFFSAIILDILNSVKERALLS